MFAAKLFRLSLSDGILQVTTDLVTYDVLNLALFGRGLEAIQARAGECGARARLCNPLPGGIRASTPRHYDRGAMKIRWTGTGRGG